MWVAQLSRRRDEAPLAQMFTHNPRMTAAAASNTHSRTITQAGIPRTAQPNARCPRLRCALRRGVSRCDGSVRPASGFGDIGGLVRVWRVTATTVVVGAA